MKIKLKGISLIVLVITIVVSLILLSIVLLNVDKNNPIDSAKEVKFKNDIMNFNDEISISYTNKKSEDMKFEFEDINVSIASKDDTGKYKIKEYIPSITDEYVDRLGIENGIIIFDKRNFSSDECDWLIESGAKCINKN